MVLFFAMLKVECESCHAPYQVDERRVPPSGLKMRCPKCGHSFVVTAKGAAPAAPVGASPPPAQRAPTMVGMGGDFDLPAIRGAAPGPGPATGGGGFGDLDLPAIPSSKTADLPMAKPRTGSPFAPIASAAPAPPPPAATATAPGFGHLDLPALPGGVDLPSAKGSGGGGGGFGDLDLPSIARGGGTELPSLAGGHAGLPAARGGFGELDLPALGGDLPTPHDAGLPGSYGGGLPTAAGSLPMAAGGQLPMAAGSLPMAAGSLPMAAGSLPMAAGSLPMAQGSLPMTAGSLPMMQGSLPSAQGELPSPQNALPTTLGGLFDGVPQGGGGGGGLVNFGDFEPGEASLSTSVPREHQGGAGGMTFGEVDLGGGDAPSAAIAPPAAISGALGADDSPGEAKLEAPPALRVRERPERRRSAVPKVIAIVLALLLVVGVALEATPFGAFGRLVVSDTLNSSSYKQRALDAGQSARRKLASDGYQTSLAAADEVAAAHAQTPRSRPLASYAAFVEFAVEARFGSDAARAGRARTFIFEIPPNSDVPYFLAAQGAQELVAGDLPHARTHLEQAAKHDAQDPIAQEIAQVQGELELVAGDPNAALAAFVRAQGKGATARSLYGVARANFAAGNMPKAKDAIDQTLAQTPLHAGALIMRATLAWQLNHDLDGSLKDLATVIEGAAKPNASLRERAQALALRGWVLLAKDHAGEARAAFEDAVKIDPKNVTALLGQGELFYQDGRYAEASTRFDEAAAKDPTSADALVGSAKTKIKLERYTDAKVQLALGMKQFPKDMRVPLWAGTTEEHLGNRNVAEQLYEKAIALADPKQPDAIGAYATLARMLSQEGRTQEAQAKLDLAKERLPDSSALQRALAEVAIASGKYDEAVQHYLAALAKDPGDTGAEFQLGVTYRKMRRFDDASKQFDKVGELDKDFPGLTLERGTLYEETGRADQALAQFKAAFDKAPNDADLKLRMGAAYVALGDIDNAKKYLKEVLDARPNSAEAKHFMGRAFLKGSGKDIDSALSYFQQAVAGDANKAIYHMYVAWAANFTSPAQTTVARDAVEKALALDKQYGDAYWQKGIYEYHSNALKDAQRDLRLALTLNPSRNEAHATLAEVLEAANDSAGALAEWQRAINVDKTNFDWDYEYGTLLLEKNQPGAAQQMLAEAVKNGEASAIHPGRLYLAHFKYATLLKKAGKKQDAIDNYKSYLQTAPPGDPDRKEAIAALSALGSPWQPN